MRLIKTRSSFRKEFRRQLRYAIAAAVGFMIIFAWRDAIFNFTQDLVEKLEKTTQVAASNITTAIILSIVGVLIIIVSSKLLKD